MDLTTLFTVIQQELSEEGFKLCPYLRNSMTCARFILHDTDVYSKKIKIGDTDAGETWYGDWLEVRQTSRKNNFGYSVAYKIIMVTCARGRRYRVEGKPVLILSCYRKPETIRSNIKVFTEEYRKYLQEKTILDKLDEILK